ncbi:MAG: ATP synthase F1 subunit delta [Candidatus Margulisbacteria bacterium]|nr:ATP synthase F1 subunit delta [Candidatus Margulisiibacteriota bacterium]MBU1022237.1 ATP synthase F1 subunit delta [Candidatus Margulisiibacteriota bacterium]MBU1729324.1 ATP synthase F1 subunit delta [Candidatus Margulisiibacteriota bacterium]MBU1955597.1 ATP synthase F1 subunit delta [Candidatus Margulisiibacteriota bacterium]
MKHFTVDYKTLYELTEREGETLRVESELFDVLNLLKTNFDLKTTLEDVRISRKFKKRLLAEILKNYSPAVLEIVNLLIEVRKLSELYNLSHHFSLFVAEKRNHMLGEFITAIRVPDKYKEKAARMLSEKYQKNVLLKNRVAPDILGGFIIKILNGKIIDASLRQKLNNLKKCMSEEM